MAWLRGFKVELSNKASNWAWDQQLPASQKFVLVKLADDADGDGYCFPGAKHVAEKTGLGESTVRAHISWLGENGYVQAADRSRQDESQTTNAFWLLLQRPAHFKPCPPNANAPPPEMTTHPTAPGPGGLEPSPESKEEPVKDSSEKDGAARLRRAAGWPEWFQPMKMLEGFAYRDHSKFIQTLIDTCAQPDVDATPKLVVASFVPYYRLNRIRHGWSDPVAVLRKTMGQEVAKVMKMTPPRRAAALEQLREISDESTRAESPNGLCEVCHGGGFYWVGEWPALCDHSGGRRTEVDGLGEDPKPYWDKVLEVLHAELPKPSYDTWLAPCRLAGVDGGSAIVLVQNKAQADWLERRVYQSLYKALIGVLDLGEDLEVKFVWEARPEKP